MEKLVVVEGKLSFYFNTYICFQLSHTYNRKEKSVYNIVVNSNLKKSVIFLK
jgi:hypothetical protein